MDEHSFAYRDTDCDCAGIATSTATTKFGFKQLRQVQIFPLLYVTYTLIRGAITGWYPYPFLNPENAGSYGGVAAYAVAIAIAIAIVCFFISWLQFNATNKLNKTHES